jgi:dynein light chain LC8-type
MTTGCAILSTDAVRVRNWNVKALDKYNVEKDIAAYIKKEFDKKYNPTWHCIVGRNFGKGCFPFLSRLS